MKRRQKCRIFSNPEIEKREEMDQTQEGGGGEPGGGEEENEGKREVNNDFMSFLRHSCAR